jgi:hypothetical protein
LQRYTTDASLRSTEGNGPAIPQQLIVTISGFQATEITCYNKALLSEDSLSKRRRGIKGLEKKYHYAGATVSSNMSSA